MESSETGIPTPEKKGRKFYRITPEQFATLPDGTELRKWALFDNTENILVKGKDTIDLNDVMNGFLPFGFFEEDVPKGLDVWERGIEIQEKSAGK